MYPVRVDEPDSKFGNVLLEQFGAPWRACRSHAGLNRDELPSFSDAVGSTMRAVDNPRWENFWQPPLKQKRPLISGIRALRPLLWEAPAEAGRASYFWVGDVAGGAGVVLGVVVVGPSVRFAVVALGPRKLSPKSM
jgi:hypothetical protein